MKALSIRQPWAWAIIHAGKPVENRTWGTRYRGPLYIHASKCYDRDGRAWIQSRLGLRVPPDLPRGGIVGMVELVDVVTAMDSPWFFGPKGLVFARPQALPFMRCGGKLGLFDAPEQGVLAL